jgi:hypothetical protein
VGRDSDPMSRRRLAGARAGMHSTALVPLKARWRDAKATMISAVDVRVDGGVVWVQLFIIANVGW